MVNLIENSSLNCTCTVQDIVIIKSAISSVLSYAKNIFLLSTDVSELVIKSHYFVTPAWFNNPLPAPEILSC